MLLKENALRKECYSTKKSKYNYVYIFKCTDCSKELRIQISGLKKHSCKCRSCSQKGQPYANIYNELKNHRNRKVEFSITFDEFLKIIAKAECEYCAEKLIYNKHSKNWGKDLTRAHQLDRKDNLKGYTYDNVVCCCWDCNRLKSDRYTYEEFLLFSEALKKIRKQRLQIK